MKNLILFLFLMLALNSSAQLITIDSSLGAPLFMAIQDDDLYFSQVNSNIISKIDLMLFAKMNLIGSMIMFSFVS